MDTPSWSATSLPHPVAMVLQDPSHIEWPARPGDAWATGHARWPLTSSGPAQAILGTFRLAARMLGYTVPETLRIQAGQLFYRNGQLDEVRLRGLCPDATPGESLWPEIAWSTPTPPRLQPLPNATLQLDPAEAGRPHLSALAVAEAVPYMLCTWVLPDAARDGTSRALVPAVPPKQPPVPLAFPDQRGTIPANPLIAAGMAALWKGGAKARYLQGGWQASEAGRPIYQHRGRKGGRILVYPHGAPSATAPLPTSEALWESAKSWGELPPWRGLQTTR